MTAVPMVSNRRSATNGPWRRDAGRSLANGIALVSALALAACAHPPEEPQARAEYERNNDPAEPTNRAIFAGNKFVDDNALQPIARGYEDYVPGRVRKSLHNFVNNLGQPAVAVNDVLQGNFSRSLNTLQRFLINTTVGGAGLFDVATGWDRPGHLADFGQTLGVWGVGPGPSVQLPLFGPSNVRDSVGKVIDLVSNPTNFIPGGAAATVSSGTGGVGFIRTRYIPIAPTHFGRKQVHAGCADGDMLAAIIRPSGQLVHIVGRAHRDQIVQVEGGRIVRSGVYIQTVIAGGANDGHSAP